MALSAPVKALALLVFLGAIGGATYGVSSYVGDTVSSQLVSLSAAHAQLNATPGHNVTYVISVQNRDAVPRDVVVEVAGLAAGRSELTTVRANSTSAVFVPLAIGADAEVGEHALDVRVLQDGRVARERAGMLTLRILAPAPGLEIGDTAEAYYTGRLAATGRVFNTNDPALATVPFPKTDSYRFSQGVLPLQTLPRPNVVAGFAEGILGMQPGESRTLTFGPEKGYGPAAEEQTQPRDETIPRTLTLRNDAQQVARETFDGYVAESGQGDPASFGVGSIFTLDQNGNDWPYVIVNKTDTIVQYRLAAEVGQTYTVYPFWANGSAVTAISNESVSFYTTPTTEVGAALTLRPEWPQMSAIHSVNDTTVVVRHSPPAGYTYTFLSELNQPREATVREVTEESILIAIPSTNPLAGRDLTFDVTLLTLTKPGSGG